MKAKDLINKKSEILEPLHDVAAELVEVDKRGKAHTIEYTDLDVAAASVTFIQIVANRKAHDYFRQGAKGNVDIKRVKSEMESYGEQIKKLVYDMTGVDLGKDEKR